MAMFIASGCAQTAIGADGNVSTAILEGTQPHDERKEAPATRLQPWAWYDEECLCGVVYGHPRIPDAHRIVTSPVVFIDEVVGIAKTMNTVYVLRDRTTALRILL